MNRLTNGWSHVYKTINLVWTTFSMTLDDVGVIGLDFTFYLNHAHHTVILDTILEKNNNHMGKIKVLSPSV